MFMLHGLFYPSPCYVSGPGNVAVVLLFMEGLKALRFKNILVCLPMMNGGLTGFGTTSG